MQTPYDWQEAIGHRASYVHSRLNAATPLFMVSHPDGIIAYTARRQARKIYEIYDRLILGATGQQSDVESLRGASIDYAHREGFNRSENDVSISRVIAAMSTALKTNFSNFNASPYVVQGVYAEVGDKLEDDIFYLLDFDGDYSIHKKVGYLLPSDYAGEDVREALLKIFEAKKSPVETAKALKALWLTSMGNESKVELPNGLCDEAMILDRSHAHITRFRALMF